MLPVPDKLAAVYAQSRFFKCSLPALSRIPVSRLFLAWSSSIGLARGEGNVGALPEGGGKGCRPPSAEVELALR